MQITKTIYQPLGLPIVATARATEVDLCSAQCFPVGTFVSITSGNCCEVDRITAASNGLITVSGNHYGDVKVQALADLSGCWLELQTQPLPPISLGIICATEAGVLLDRKIDECIMGRTLSVNGKSLGVINGAAVVSGDRSVISVDKPIKIEGVGIALAGQPQTTKGAIAQASPFATISAALPSSGTMALYLRQGWRSTKACVPDVISYSELLCAGVLG